ncbi:hypothetical protein HD806DRAFT_552587 [Xylariaceae sp. AK1471]|nr:hypothetical protein HD806DRAFT_552587 [Xylariaceae sp. AK1471]
MSDEAKKTLHTTQPICARVGCKSHNQNLKACTGCFLVQYYSTDCQKQDWPDHKTTCKSPLSRSSWRPAHEKDGRLPSWKQPAHGLRPQADKIPIRRAEDPPHTVSKLYSLNETYTDFSLFECTQRWLFDDMPAMDVLQVDSNEWTHDNRPLSILFAGAGDMADFIKTVASLPSEAQISPLRVVLNEQDYCVTSRNIVILLLAMTSEDPRATAELVVQLWYSAFLPVGYFDRILEQLEPHMKHPQYPPKYQLGFYLQNAVLQDPVKFIRNPRAAIQTHTAAPRNPSSSMASSSANTGDTVPAENKWIIGNCSLRYEPKLNDSPDAFEFLRRPFIYGGNMLYPLRLNQYHQTLMKPWQGEGENYDIWDRILELTPREWRVPRKAYHEERVLLPFGHERNGPWAKPLTNPSYYFSALMYGEAMRVNSDPIEGWPIDEVLKNELSPKNDIYGKLFYYVRDMLEKFIIRLKSLKIDIEVHCCEAEKLATRLTGLQFDRIHTSNLADGCYMGTESMLKSLSQLLKPKSANPNARLISLHHCSDRTLRSSLKRERWISRVEWSDMELQALDRVGAPLGMATVENALTTPWPFRVDSTMVGSEASEPVPNGTFTKIELLNATGRNITARYVEWQRAD